MSGETLQAYYAARALEYDEVYLKPERQTDLRAIELWLAARFIDVHVLEVACGTGYWTQFIAPLATAITAVDAAAETLKIAEQRVRNNDVHFSVGDAYALPRIDGNFDAAFAGFWFSHVPKERRQEFLSGLHARLKPGARVILLDNLYVENSSSAIVGLDASGNTFQTRRLNDGAEHRVLKNFPDEAELRALLANSGKNAVFKTWPHFWAFEYDVA